MKFHDRELDVDYIERRIEAQSILQKIRIKLKKEGVTQCECEDCKEIFPLSFIDLHHVVPIAEGGKADGDIVTLCRKCHYKAHGKDYNPQSILIDEEEWILYALQNKKQIEIAAEMNVGVNKVQKAWQLYKGNRMKWATFKKLVRKGVITPNK